MIKKIVAIGPESTGKSMLCEQLAQHFNTTWCPEYARAYLNENGVKYDYTDLSKIAQGQLVMEDYCNWTKLEAQNSLLFIDTNMYVMKVWYEYVFKNANILFWMKLLKENMICIYSAILTYHGQKMKCGNILMNNQEKNYIISIKICSLIKQHRGLKYAATTKSVCRQQLQQLKNIALIICFHRIIKRDF